MRQLRAKEAPCLRNLAHLPLRTFSVADDVQQSSMLHLCCCLVPAAGIMVAALSGLYGTVAYFHSRLESIVGILIGTATLHGRIS